jgi:hypothetical protein
LGLALTREELEGIANAIPGYIERLLRLVRMKVEEKKAAKAAKMQAPVKKTIAPIAAPPIAVVDHRPAQDAGRYTLGSSFIRCLSPVKRRFFIFLLQFKETTCIDTLH